MNFPWGKYIGIEPPAVEVPRTYPAQAGEVVGVRPCPARRGFPDVEVRLDLEGEAPVVAANQVFPAVDVGARVWLYPNPEGGMQLHDPAWLLDGPGVAPGTDPLRLGDFEALFLGHERAIRGLLQEVGVDRGGLDTAISRAKVDDIARRLGAVADPGLRARARAIGRQVTLGDPVVAHIPRPDGRPADHYGWKHGRLPDLGVIVRPEGKLVPVGQFVDDLVLFDVEGSVLPSPGLHLLALSKAAERLGPLPARVISVQQEGVEVELFGVRHAIPQAGLTWSATRPIVELFRPGEVAWVRPDLSRGLWMSVEDPQPPVWLDRIPEAPTALPRASWRVASQSEDETRVVVEFEPGASVLGVVKDRWFPDWDESVDLAVTNVDRTRRCLILIDVPTPDPDRRALADDWKVGDPIRGVVSARVKAGYVVEVDGRRCLFKQKHDRMEGPAQVEMVVGEAFEGWVRKLDNRRHRLLVGLTKPGPDGGGPGALARMGALLSGPEKAEALGRIEPGQVIVVRVRNLADFGAFVDIGGIEGLLHITDMSWIRINHPSEVVQTGDRIEVVVLRVDREREKVALGHKQLLPNPWEGFAARHPAGDRVEGEVVNLMSYGAFIRFEESVQGLVHISEMSWTKRINHPSELVNIGDKIKVVVLGSNPAKENISLGMKQLVENPWDTVAARYPPGSLVEGTIRNFTNYGAFIEIEEGIDGLLHISEMSWTRKIGHPNEVLEKGQKIRCQILDVDQDHKRIALGLKQLKDDPWETNIPNRYKPGDIVNGKVTKLSNFGVFVELEPELEELVHISELAEPADLKSVGDQVEVLVLRVDAKERKIGLSRNLDAFGTYPPGFDALAAFESRVAGRIVEVLPTGLILKLDGGGFGRVALRETCWDAPEPEDDWVVGMRLETLAIGPPKYVRDLGRWEVDLSVRLTRPDPWGDRSPSGRPAEKAIFDATVVWVDPEGQWARVRPLGSLEVALVMRSPGPNPAEDIAGLRPGQLIRSLRAAAYDEQLRQLSARLPKPPKSAPEAAQASTEAPKPSPTPRPAPAPAAERAPFDRYPIGTKSQRRLVAYEAHTGCGTITLDDGVSGRLVIPPSSRQRYKGRLIPGQQIEVEVTQHATKMKIIIFKLVSVS